MMVVFITMPILQLTLIPDLKYSLVLQKILNLLFEKCSSLELHFFFNR